MNIQEYNEIITLIAKVETKKEVYEKLDAEFKGVNSIQDADRWMELYDKTTRARKAMKKAYADFRKKIDNEEYGYLAHMFRYSQDQSDKNFYYYASREIIYRESQRIRFE